MQVRAALRGVREPGERLIGWAVVLPSGRRAVMGSAFLLGVMAPVMLPVSLLAGAWSQGAGRRLAVLTDRKVVLLRAGIGRPRVDAVGELGGLRMKAGSSPVGAVRVRVRRGSRCVWYRAMGTGLEHRFVAGVRAMADAGRAGFETGSGTDSEAGLGVVCETGAPASGAEARGAVC